MMKRLPVALHGVAPNAAASAGRLLTGVVSGRSREGTVLVVGDDDVGYEARLAVPLGGVAQVPESGTSVLLLRGRAPGEAPVIISTIFDDIASAEEAPPTLDLSAKERVVIRCGDAEITMTRDGGIEIRGGYVETYAEGTNRIKGAQVRIN